MTIGKFLTKHIINFTSTMLAVLVHLIWFIVWFVFKLDTNLLTNLVSLEAIFLSIFVMIAQKQQAEEMVHHKQLTKDLHRKIDEHLKR